LADAFISYVEEDSSVAAGVARILEDAGISSWRYEADAVGGRNYLLQTRDQIEGAKAFVVVLSRASIASEQVDREIVRAHEFGKAFLPILRDLPYAEFARRRPAWQQAMGAVTALSVPDGDVEALGDRLVAGVREVLGRPTAAGAGDARAEPFGARLRRVLASRRARRVGLLVLAFSAAVAFGVHAFVERRAAEDRSDAAEAKREAVRLLDAGRAGEARPLLERALALTPSDSEVHLHLGRLHHEAREPERAVEHLDRRLRAQPLDAAARYWRGLAHVSLGHPDEALADLSAAIGSGALPEDAHVNASFERGTLLLDRNMPKHPVRVDLTQEQRREVQDAERDFTVVHDARGWVSALIERGRARSWLLLDEPARADLAEAYRRASGSGRSDDAPAASEAAYLLGLLDLREALRSGRSTDLSRALESFDVALRHEPASLKAKVGRALTRTSLGHLPEGVGELEQLLQGLPSSDPMRPTLSTILDEVRKAAAELPVQDLVVDAATVEGPEGTGVEFRVSAAIRRRVGVPCRVVVRFFEVARSPYLHRWEPLRAPDARYAAPDGTLVATARVVPTEDPFAVEDVRVYLPYSQTPLYDGPQRYEFTLAVHDDAGPISRLVDGSFSFTKSAR
jgi:tetratricopeptide (TPR) repeat protein